MIRLGELPGQPFDAVFDVGGNIGEWAQAAHECWPKASLVSFEPLPGAARAQRERANGRWVVYETAIGEFPDELVLHFCVNQHSASTLHAGGTVRRDEFGIVDRHQPLLVDVLPLDRFLPLARDAERLLVKVDVEGHEREVLKGAPATLDRAETVLIEVQNDRDIFPGSPPAWLVDELLRGHGLYFAGVADALCTALGRVLQFDGVWTRTYATNRNSGEWEDMSASRLSRLEEGLSSR